MEHENMKVVCDDCPPDLQDPATEAVFADINQRGKARGEAREAEAQARAQKKEANRAKLLRIKRKNWAKALYNCCIHHIGLAGICVWLSSKWVPDIPAAAALYCVVMLGVYRLWCIAASYPRK